MISKKLITILIISINIISLLFLTGCQENREDKITQEEIISTSSGTYIELIQKLDKEPETKQFKDENELSSFILNNIGQKYNYMASGIRGDIVMNDSAVPMMAEMAVGSKAVVSDYSTTNIQVQGIDEADILKTDGNYIYTISKDILYIIKAYPGDEAEIISTIKFNNSPSSLFINNDMLAIFGNFNDKNYWNKMDFISQSGMSFFHIYDISNRKNPELIKDYIFEGMYFNARMKEDNIYFITSTMPEYRPRPMPIIIEDNILRSVDINNIYYYNINYLDPIYVNIHSINIINPEKKINSKSIIVESSQNMYMSENNIYITYTDYINEYDIEKQITIDLFKNNLSEYENDLIKRIKITDNDILSRYEKEQKIWQIYLKHISMLSIEEQDKFQNKIEELMKLELEKYDSFEYTIIHKINIDKDKITPETNGKIPGRIINQFSMDEYNNIFRIATTISQRWSRFDNKRRESTNNIFTLNMDLEVLDSETDIAEGERIYSTRFIGEKLYMVTFREIDPFFVVDLSNPNNIKILGELKIPGFSTYLHPYDKNTIIGIGQEATETGSISGLKVSLFDVSNVNNPIETAKYVTDEKYAQSTALYEHKAFLFSKEKKLLIIPVYNYDSRDDINNYNGAFVFNIKKDEIKLRGLIDHSKASEYSWQPAVERSLYIEELLYTKSSKLLRINKINDLNSVKNISLDASNNKIPIY
jgi:inhibitor of cysteine peptidase